ncbi:hypothetical protein C7M84_002263 [Penaeus vannamei]|uniref:Uncharacterized protein n=1 Tax=Penaeus vannamei TaxID=6689 RepID=A0A423TRD6_PENVA|nr:hypothetical protein C7M84_002263 [Penaeus vannamei]
MSARGTCGSRPSIREVKEEVTEQLQQRDGENVQPGRAPPVLRVSPFPRTESPQRPRRRNATSTNDNKDAHYDRQSSLNIALAPPPTRHTLTTALILSFHSFASPISFLPSPFPPSFPYSHPFPHLFFLPSFPLFLHPISPSLRHPKTKLLRLARSLPSSPAAPAPSRSQVNARLPLVDAPSATFSKPSSLRAPFLPSAFRCVFTSDVSPLFPDQKRTASLRQPNQPLNMKPILYTSPPSRPSSLPYPLHTHSTHPLPPIHPIILTAIHSLKRKEKKRRGKNGPRSPRRLRRLALPTLINPIQKSQRRDDRARCKDAQPFASNRCHDLCLTHSRTHLHLKGALVILRLPAKKRGKTVNYSRPHRSPSPHNTGQTLQTAFIHRRLTSPPLSTSAAPHCSSLLLRTRASTASRSCLGRPAPLAEARSRPSPSAPAAEAGTAVKSDGAVNLDQGLGSVSACKHAGRAG